MLEYIHEHKVMNNGFNVTVNVKRRVKKEEKTREKKLFLCVQKISSRLKGNQENERIAYSIMIWEKEHELCIETKSTLGS